MSLHLLRCQGLAVDNYSVALGRLEAGATSTFAQLGFYTISLSKKRFNINFLRPSLYLYA
jgi:hypothetical protein